MSNDGSESAVRMVWTSPWREHQDADEIGRKLAAWFECRFVSRRSRSIPRVLSDECAEVLGVWDGRPTLYHRSNPELPLFFHPGMAQQRTAADGRGEHDRLLKVAGIRAGDLVVDATLGMGVDAMVVAYGVGPHGHVIGVESSKPLARLFKYAVDFGDPRYQAAHALLSRIQVVEGHHMAFLSELEADSVDVVLFDPMFRHPPGGPTSIDSARGLAMSDPLSSDAWKQAQRVARRCVVLKERPRSSQFARFDVLPDKPRATIAYGVWHKGR